MTAGRSHVERKTLVNLCIFLKSFSTDLTLHSYNIGRDITYITHNATVQLEVGVAADVAWSRDGKRATEVYHLFSLSPHQNILFF